MVMLNATQVKSEDDIVGRSRPVPGRYHVAINHAQETASKKKGTPGLDLEFTVVCDGLTPDGKGRTTGQANKTIPLFLSYTGETEQTTETCLSRVTRLALCAGVLNPGEEAEVNWAEAVGRELVIEVEEQAYKDQAGNDKKGTQVSFLGFWSLANAAVANVPKDPGSPGMQAMARGKGAPPTGPKTTTAPVQTTAPTTKKASLMDL